MAAMGMPGFVIRYLKRKAPSVRITSIDGENDKDWYKWEYLVGEQTVSRHTNWCWKLRLYFNRSFLPFFGLGILKKNILFTTMKRFRVNSNSQHIAKLHTLLARKNVVKGCVTHTTFDHFFGQQSISKVCIITHKSCRKQCASSYRRRLQDFWYKLYNMKWIYFV